MNILVTGSNGQLGNEVRIVSESYKSFNFYFTDIEQLDITDYQKLEEFVTKIGINCIINCSGYTAVDKAESEKDLAFLINDTSVGYLADISSKFKILLIHVSTDYVFDGMSYIPYNEDDTTNPLSVYGSSKLAGEKKILSSNADTVIIRTSWLYSSFGNNFVKTMIRLGNERDILKVVFDQVGSPTYAYDLAVGIMKIVETERKGISKEVYHFSNEGVTSWYDFAIAIMEEMNIKCKVLPIETKDYPTPAKRPFYSVFNKSKIKNKFIIEIPHWRNSLREMLKKL